MIVRARIKPLEQFPPEWKCCDRAVAAAQQFQEMLLDLEVRTERSAHCAYCDSPSPKAVWVRDTVDGLFVPLAVVDIDEGPQ